MNLTYALALVLSLSGLAVLDWRYRLALWNDKRRAVLTVLYGTLVFIAWDIGGIALGIFKHGTSAYSLPFTVLPEFPFEEILFLVLLCYTTLILYRGIHRLCSPT